MSSSRQLTTLLSKALLPSESRQGSWGCCLARAFHRGGKDRVLQCGDPFPSLPSLPLRPEKMFSSLPDVPRLWSGSWLSRDDFSVGGWSIWLNQPPLTASLGLRGAGMGLDPGSGF